MAFYQPRWVASAADGRIGRSDVEDGLKLHAFFWMDETDAWRSNDVCAHYPSRAYEDGRHSGAKCLVDEAAGRYLNQSARRPAVIAVNAPRCADVGDLWTFLHQPGALTHRGN